MGCGASSQNTSVQQAPILQTKASPKGESQILTQRKQSKSVDKNQVNKNDDIRKSQKSPPQKVSTPLTKIKEAKSPAKGQDELRTSSKSLPKEQKNKSMATTKTTTISQDSQKQVHLSPSKVKIQVQGQVRQNQQDEDDLNDDKNNDIRQSKKKKKGKGKKKEEQKLSGLMKIYGL